jgi:alpha-N-arabinofuranosidase
MTSPNPPARFRNPILPGFHPDPSICRAGDDYFLVNSSFAYFPGVPLFHSRDLVHWRQIGHCLTRPEQLPLGRTGTSGGIFAPTIRSQDGVFYMVTTNITGGGNFYVTTRDPSGEWSDPIWVDQGGIDPSLCFHAGRAYLTSTGSPEEGDPLGQGQGILQSEIDLSNGRLLARPRLVWRGMGGAYPEGPHLYRIGQYFYLMIAEGGTEYGHSEVIARSQSPWGPWESCPHNPILTHRGLRSPIQALGHADLVEAQDGAWWLVCLGIRPATPNAHHLGRETFLARVDWNADGWPQVGRAGRIELEMEAPNLTQVTWADPPRRDDFDSQDLAPKWNFLGLPRPQDWSLNRRAGSVCLQGQAADLDDGMGVVFLGCRQEQFNCEAAAALDFDPAADGEQAGLATWMDARHHYEIFVGWQEGRRFIGVRRRIGSLAAIVARQDLPAGPVRLRIHANRLFYAFSYTAGEAGERMLATGETRYLSSEVAGGFTGVYFALYASGSGRPASTPAYFDWFECLDRETPGMAGIDSPLGVLLQDERTRQVLQRHLPGLVANPPAEWGSAFSLLELEVMNPGGISPESILAVDAGLRAAGVAVLSA